MPDRVTARAVWSGGWAWDASGTVALFLERRADGTPTAAPWVARRDTAAGEVERTRCDTFAGALEVFRGWARDARELARLESETDAL